MLGSIIREHELGSVPGQVKGQCNTDSRRFWNKCVPGVGHLLEFGWLHVEGGLAFRPKETWKDKAGAYALPHLGI